MIKITIKNLSGDVTHGSAFATQELADVWIESQKSTQANCSWGRPAWTETLDDETTVQHEDQFTIEISDITSEYAFKSAQASVIARRQFAEKLLATFTVENAMLGITVEQSDEVLAKLSGVLTTLTNGFLETAILRTKAIDPTDYDATFITASRLLQYVNAIETYLEITLSTEI